MIIISLFIKCLLNFKNSFKNQKGEYVDVVGYCIYEKENAIEIKNLLRLTTTRFKVNDIVKIEYCKTIVIIKLINRNNLVLPLNEGLEKFLSKFIPQKEKKSEN